MPHLLVTWVLSALSLYLVAKMVSGIEMDGCGSALLAAIVVGFINSTLGTIFRLATTPLIILTFGLFVFLINAVVLKLAAALVPGFRIRGFAPAVWGAIVLSLVSLVLRYVIA